MNFTSYVSIGTNFNLNDNNKINYPGTELEHMCAKINGICEPKSMVLKSRKPIITHLDTYFPTFSKMD